MANVDSILGRGLERFGVILPNQRSLASCPLLQLSACHSTLINSRVGPKSQVTLSETESGKEANFQDTVDPVVAL
jgi:hypothetical protein